MTCELLGLTEAEGQLAVRVGCDVELFRARDTAGEQRDRVVVGTARDRVVGTREYGCERAVGVGAGGGLEPVVRDGSGFAAAGLEVFRDAPVQPQPTAGGELVDEDAAHQGVGEPVLVDTGVFNEACFQCGLEAGDHLLVTDSRCGDDVTDPKVAPHYCRGAQHVGAVRSERVETLPEHLLDPFGDPELADTQIAGPAALAAHDRAGLDQVTDHLADEEWVALGLRH